MKPKVCNSCPFKKKCVFDVSKSAKLGFINHVHCVYYKEYEKDKNSKKQNSKERTRWIME